MAAVSLLEALAALSLFAAGALLSIGFGIRARGSSAALLGVLAAIGVLYLFARRDLTRAH